MKRAGFRGRDQRGDLVGQRGSSGGIHLKEAAARHRKPPERQFLLEPGRIAGGLVAPISRAAGGGPTESDVHSFVQGVQKGFVAAQLREFRVDFGMGQRTCFDIGDRGVVAHHIAEHGAPPHLVHVQHDLVAVAERRFGGDGRFENARSRFQPGLCQLVGQLRGFQLGFIRIAGVQIAAAGAASEVRTGRFDPVRTGRAEPHGFGA